MLYSYLGRWFLSADLFLDSEQTFGNAQEVDGLRDTEERRDYNHSAEATLEEGGDAFVLQSFPESESFQNVQSFASSSELTLCNQRLH